MTKKTTAKTSAKAPAAKLQETREAWLNRANLSIRAWFKEVGFPLPEKIRISCGFPAGRGSKKFIGQCWSPEASKDKTTEIFINPTQDDAFRVLDILVHEDVHAAVGNKCGHKGPFIKCAKVIGLTGKWTATVAGPELKGKIDALLKTLPPYPHAAINLGMSPIKKQSTRLLKATCDCGYTVRITRKWVDEVGAPHCPVHGEMELEE